MTSAPAKRTKAKTLDECATWPTVFAITCHECGGLLGDSRGPRCTECRLGMGAELTSALMSVVAKASTCPPGSIARTVGARTLDDGNAPMRGRYTAIDPHARRSF